MPMAHTTDTREASKDAGAASSESRHLFAQALSAMDSKDLSRATELVRGAIRLCPGDGHYWRALGELLAMRNLHAEAMDAFAHALKLHGPSAEIHFSMAGALDALGHETEASDHYARSVALAPEWPEAWFNHGTLLMRLERPEAAWVALEKAVALRPDWTAAWFNLGAAADQLGLNDQADACWRQVLSKEPGNIQASIHAGIAQYRQQHFDAAAALFADVLRMDPGASKAHMHLGLCLQHMDRVEEAAASYRRALDLQPEYAECWFNLATVLHRLARWDEVIACYCKAIALNPKNAAAHFNLAASLRRKERIGEALVHCGQAMTLDPNFSEAKAYLLQLALHACDWHLAEQLSPVVDHLSAQQISAGQKPSESPMLSLRRHADPWKNLAIAKAWSDWLAEQARLMPDRPCFTHAPRADRSIIRVGYISHDFKDHAVAHHLLGLVRAHRRERFQVYLYACNPEDGSAYRRKLMQASDHFIQLDRLSHAAAAQRIYADRIDLLIDLMGHTRGGRQEVLALRPAPVQAGYLGFLGSSGASFIDYFFTDAVVTPPSEQACYTEKLVYLPGCYQVNDDRMPIGETLDRAQYGLGEDQLVLCCFNQSYKIDRRCFQAWLAILNAVPKAVLWLLRPNTTAQDNLRQAAHQAGIRADRIIFAGPLRIDRHLARLRVADLALDTFTYNGGATTSNALWAGVPVLTLSGHHLVSRMSASALVAVGLPEMITHCPGEYARKAIDLLNHRPELMALRAKLQGLKNGSSLFDSQRFSAHMESAFEKMLARFDAGMAPASFSIESKPGLKAHLE